MKMRFRVVIEDPKWDEPVVHQAVIQGTSKAAILKQLKLSGRHICELKNTGKTNWRDRRGVFHGATLADEHETPSASHQTVPEKQSTLSKLKGFLCRPFRRQT